jgi:hypothetical protein
MSPLRLALAVVLAAALVVAFGAWRDPANVFSFTAGVSFCG